MPTLLGRSRESTRLGRLIVAEPERLQRRIDCAGFGPPGALEFLFQFSDEFVAVHWFLAEEEWEP